MKRLYSIVVIASVYHGQSHALSLSKIAALKMRVQGLTAVMAREYAHKDVAPNVHVEIVPPRAQYAPSIIKDGKAWGAAKVDHEDGTLILINAALKNQPPEVQSFAILHELAHAYDFYINDTDDIYEQLSLCEPHSLRDIFTYYPYLREDAQAYINKLKKRGDLTSGLQILSYEWYADWKALNVMKRILPSEALDLKEKYEFLIASHMERLNSPEYPPLEILLKWLNEEPKD